MGSLLKGHGSTLLREADNLFRRFQFFIIPSNLHRSITSTSVLINLGVKMATRPFCLLKTPWTTIFAPIQEMRTHMSAAMMRLEPSHDFEFCKSVGCIGPQDFLNRICSAIPLRATTKYVAAAGIFQSHHLVSSCNSTAALADRSPSCDRGYCNEPLSALSRIPRF